MKKFAAFAMAAVMFCSLLMTSCSSKENDANVIKKTDPWYESYRYDLKIDLNSNQDCMGHIACYGNDRLYFFYNIYDYSDYDNSHNLYFDTYDDSGEQLSHKRLYTSSGYTLTGIQSVKPSDDGKNIDALVEVFQPGAFSHACCKIDIETGEVSGIKILKMNGQSSVEVNDYGFSEVHALGDYYVAVVMDGMSGRDFTYYFFVFKGSEYISTLDISSINGLTMLEDFSYDKESNTVYSLVYTRNEGHLLVEFDPETGALKNKNKYDPADDEPTVADFTALSSGGLYKLDTMGNITQYNLETKTEEVVLDNGWYTPYFSDLTFSKLIHCAGDKFVSLTSKFYDYATYTSNYVISATIIKKAETNPNAGKKIIEIVMPVSIEALSDYMSKAIYEFNKTDNEYLIRVWSKYKTGFKTGRMLFWVADQDEKTFTMIQELNGEDGPDLSIGIQQNYAMRDDVFEDLSGYLDQDVLDKQFGNIIEAARMDGKLYFLPVTICIEGLVTDRSYIAPDASGLTFEEYDKMVREKLDGFQPYDYPLSSFSGRYPFIMSCIDTKAATEGDTVNFDTEQFRKTVEYTKENIVDSTIDLETEFALEKQKPRTGSRYDMLYSYLDFVKACNSSVDSYTVIGTPSVNAAGPRFRASETISVTASSDMKEGCRKFINYLFRGDWMDDSSMEFFSLVTNKEIMKKNISVLSARTTEEYDKMMSLDVKFPADDLVLFGDKRSSADMEEQFYNCMSTISTYYYQDNKISSMIMEELGPYFAGDRTLDDAIAIINDRVNKYVKEM